MLKDANKIISTIYSHYNDAAGACIDSRKVKKGSIFFGIPGQRQDGGLFAEEALAAGAAMAVVEIEAMRGMQNIIVVPNAVEALQSTALRHRASLNYPIIAITGSNGKTTTRMLLETALATRYNVQATKGNYNNELGTPLTILSMGSAHEIGIVEMGANHVGEIAFLCEIARPTHGLITSIGAAHLEGFGSIEGVAKTKGELFAYLKENSGTGFVRDDDPHIAKMAEQIHLGCSASHYSLASYKAVNRNSSNEQFTLTVEWEGKQHTINSQLIGAYNAINLVAAVHVANYFNIDFENACHAVSNYAPTNHRSQLIERNGRRIIADCYNANLSSMQAAIESFSAMTSEKRKIAILGSMLEMGSESAHAHKTIRQIMAKHTAISTLFVGSEWGGVDTQNCFQDWQSCAEHLQTIDLHDTLILLKGSHGIALDKLLELL